MIDESDFSKLLLEHSLWGVLLVDSNRDVVTFANKKANNMLRDSETTIVGRLFSDFIPSDNEINSDIDFFRKDGFFGEIYLRRENESLFPAQVTIKLVTHNDEKFSLVSFQDVSAQKRMQRDLLVKHEGLKEVLKELTEKNNELLLLDKAKDKFLSLITHELRTPLNTIVATSEVIFYKMYNTEVEFNDLAKNLFEQGHNILDLVNDILDLTKIHSGRVEFYIEESDINEIIEKQRVIFSEMASKNQTEIIFQRPATQILCYFDSVRLNQIIGNLIGNAIKFNRPDGKVYIGVSEQNSMIEVSFRDQGVGIPENKFDSIFNEFETIESITNHHKGTGLGLPIVKLLVEAHGGKVSLKSEMGIGTIFYISFPTSKVLAPEFYRSRKENDDFVIFGSEDDN